MVALENPRTETVATLALDAMTLRAALKNAALFAARDQLRRIIDAVLFDAKEGNLRLVATDSYRIVIQDVACECTVAGRWLVSRSDCERFVKQLPTKGSEIAVLRFRERECELRAANTITTSERLVEGDYPNFEMLAEWDKPFLVPNGTGGGNAAFNPAFLADIGKLVPLDGNKHACVLLETNGSKCARFRLGAITGGLMPVRA